MQPDLTFTIMARLLLAAILGGIVGLERELSKKPAGLRTNMFIGMGAALFTIISQEVAAQTGGDAARIAAQIIPGIGFIGAGAILRERGEVVGLTTAATIFVVASVGMAVGTGMYLTASFAAVLTLAALVVLGWAEDRFSPKTRLVAFQLRTATLEDVLPPMHQALDEAHVNMREFQVTRMGEEFQVEFQAELTHRDQDGLMERLQALPARCEVQLLNPSGKQ